MLFFKLLKKTFIFFLFLLIPLILYIAIAHLLTFFPTKIETFLEQNKTIYISYSQLHSDIIINIESLDQKWKEKLPKHIIHSNGYLSFGWGDKEFYLNTPTWDDLKITSAFKALFLNSPSVVYVKYYRDISYFQDLKEVKLSNEQLKDLEKSIFKSFDFEHKKYKGYGRDDIFYSSPYQYNIFTTCNTWTGEQLKEANVSVSPWTPFSYNIINSLP